MTNHTSGNDKTNFVQVEWYCNKCDAKHFGNCPLIKITTTATTTELIDLVETDHAHPQVPLKSAINGNDKGMGGKL